MCHPWYEASTGKRQQLNGHNVVAIKHSLAASKSALLQECEYKAISGSPLGPAPFNGSPFHHNAWGTHDGALLVTKTARIVRLE